MSWMIDGKEYNNDEYMELKKRERAEWMARRMAEEEAKETAREEAAQLMRQLGQAYTAYKEFMGRHPQLNLRLTEGEAADHDLYQNLRENLERADQAPRCTHIKADGLRCGSPRMKTAALCYAHQRMAETRPETPQTLRLPSMMMEDANSIQISLMEVTRALLGGQITEKAAAKLLYSLQIAASNVDRLTFHEAPDEMVVDEPVMPADSRKQEAFSYETLDEDLKLRLQEISDEMDRRIREKHASAKLTTEDTKEHRGEPGILGFETGFEAVGHKTGAAESRAGHDLMLTVASEHGTSPGSMETSSA